MLKRGNLILLALSVILALVTTLVIERELNHYKIDHQTRIPTKQVVIVQKSLGLHEEIQSDDVAIKKIPVSAVEPGAATEVSQVVGQYTKTVWIPDQQVVTEMYGNGNAISFSLSVPKGERAFTLPDSPIAGVDHLIQPGDHVDVLITGSGNQASSLQPIILSDLLVLYVDQVQALVDSPENKGAGKSQSGGVDTLTLAVTPAQAQVLATEGNGQLHIALRNPID